MTYATTTKVFNGKPNGSISLYRDTQDEIAYISITLAVCNTCILLVQHFDGKVTLEQCLRAFFVGPTGDNVASINVYNNTCINIHVIDKPTYCQIPVVQWFSKVDRLWKV